MHKNSQPVIESNISDSDCLTVKITSNVERQSKLANLLVFSLYADGPIAGLTEAMSNAFDAQLDSPYPDSKVEVTLSNENGNFNDEYELTIRDYGLGMSPDLMQRVYPSLGESTKEDDPRTKGEYGLGAKAIIRLCDTVEIRTIYQGRAYTWAFCRDGQVSTNLYLLNEEDTDERSGTRIKLLVSRGLAHRIVDRLENIGVHRFPDIQFYPETLHQKVARAHAQFIRTDDESIYYSYYYPSSCIEPVVVIGSIPYSLRNLSLSLNALDTHPGKEAYISTSSQNKIYLRFNPGVLTENASREEIENSPQNQKLIEDKVKEAFLLMGKNEQLLCDQYGSYVEYARATGRSYNLMLCNYGRCTFENIFPEDGQRIYITENRTVFHKDYYPSYLSSSTRNKLIEIAKVEKGKHQTVYSVSLANLIQTPVFLQTNRNKNKAQRPETYYELTFKKLDNVPYTDLHSLWSFPDLPKPKPIKEATLESVLKKSALREVTKEVVDAQGSFDTSVTLGVFEVLKELPSTAEQVVYVERASPINTGPFRCYFAYSGKSVMYTVTNELVPLLPDNWISFDSYVEKVKEDLRKEYGPLVCSFWGADLETLAKQFRPKLLELCRNQVTRLIGYVVEINEQTITEALKEKFGDDLPVKKLDHSNYLLKAYYILLPTLLSLPIDKAKRLSKLTALCNHYGEDFIELALQIINS